MWKATTSKHNIIELETVWKFYSLRVLFLSSSDCLLWLSPVWPIHLGPLLVPARKTRGDKQTETKRTGRESVVERKSDAETRNSRCKEKARVKAGRYTRAGIETGPILHSSIRIIVTAKSRIFALIQNAPWISQQCFPVKSTYARPNKFFPSPRFFLHRFLFRIPHCSLLFERILLVFQNVLSDFHIFCFFFNGMKRCRMSSVFYNL